MLPEVLSKEWWELMTLLTQWKQLGIVPVIPYMPGACIPGYKVVK